MAASLAVRTSFDLSDRSSFGLPFSSVLCRGMILIATVSPVSEFLATLTLPMLP